MSYQPKVYRKQGGDELVVASSGVVTIENGGIVKMPVVSATSDDTLTNYGISTISRTTALGVGTYSIAAPVAGCHKIINCQAANTSDHAIIQASTAVTFDPAGNKDKLKIVSAGAISLFGLSTSAWALAYASTAQAFATS